MITNEGFRNDSVKQLMAPWPQIALDLLGKFTYLQSGNNCAANTPKCVAAVKSHFYMKIKKHQKCSMNFLVFSQFGYFFLFKEKGTLDNNVSRKFMFIVHK